MAPSSEPRGWSRDPAVTHEVLKRVRAALTDLEWGHLAELVMHDELLVERMFLFSVYPPRRD